MIGLQNPVSQPITCTLCSESGTDWTKPIPALEALALAAGLSVIGALAGLRRRRRPARTAR